LRLLIIGGTGLISTGIVEHLAERGADVTLFNRAQHPGNSARLPVIVGDRNVRIVPDVAVSGAGSNPGMVDGLLGIMLRNQTGGSQQAKQN